MFVYPHAVCPDCGVALPLGQLDEHECDEQRWLDHQIRLALPELARIDQEIASFLETPEGRFELWYARRQRVKAA
jgi:hypothetical protein